MKQFLYIMPAVLIGMLYALLAALAGGIKTNGGAASLVSPWAHCWSITA